MTVLRSLFGGDASAALASLIFIPLAHCYSEEDALKLEKLFIDTEHPPLNEPYVQKLLPVVLSHLSLEQGSNILSDLFEICLCFNSYKCLDLFLICSSCSLL